MLKAFRTNEIDGAVGDLSDTDVDVLMKYLYKGFSSSPDKAASLLLWHEKVSSKFTVDRPLLCESYPEATPSVITI